MPRRSANAITDANGRAQIDLYPPGADWVILRATTSGTVPAAITNPKQPICDLYLGGTDQNSRVDGTYTGLKDTAYNVGVATPGTNITAIWTGADPGVLVTLTIEVRQYPTGRAPPDVGSYVPFTNSVVGGNTLVRNAIRSPNFQPGGPGWSINADGSAEFGTLTTDGGRYVAIGAAGGQAFVAEVTGDIHARWKSTFDGQLAWGDGTANPDISITRIANSTLEIDARPTVIPVGPLISVGTIKAQDPNQAYVVGVGPAVADTWHAMTLANGWTNFGGGFQTAKYTRLPNPAVHIVGVIAPGTKVDGTIIATLPAGYRPGATIRFPIGQDGAVATNQRMDLDSAGNLKINGVNLAGLAAIEFNEIIPLDA